MSIGIRAVRPLHFERLCMPSSPSRQDPMQVPAAADAPVRPQHHGIFLEPAYTVELPPLNEGEDDGEGEALFERISARRHTPGQRRG
ncbi:MULTISPECIES: hypothetical protein [unclassified Streptomyces]|uniref:hypothetical protein n=1 Tax=unclassified Streptomyces TaxID=2593676 RepID=UPI0012FF4A5F|nr:hypothetical protein [Streptomyces sp. NBC_00370]